MNTETPTHHDDPADDLLRQALRTEADAIDPVPDWNDVLRRSRRTSARRWIPAAAAAALIVVVGVGIAIQDRSTDQNVATDPTPAVDPTDSSTSVPDTAGPETTPPDQPEPGTDQLDQAEERRAGETVDEFVTALRGEDYAFAARLWSGYPEYGPDDPAAVDHVRLWWADANEPYLSGDPDEIVIVPAWAFTEPKAIVTYRYAGDVALAFLVDVRDASVGGSIVRLPDMPGGWGPIPEARSALIVSDRIVFPTRPVEGGARAFFGSTEVPVTVDHERGEMSVIVPGGLDGFVALTLTVATPEEPTADAFIYLIRRAD